MTKGPRHLSLEALGSRDQKALEALGAVPDEFVILGERVITKAAKDAFPEAPAWAVRELVKFAGGDGLYSTKGSPPYTGVNPWRHDSFNLTQQHVIRKENPELAKELERRSANPWARETFNLTQQVLIGRENPELAKELAREAAGVPQR